MKAPRWNTPGEVPPLGREFHPEPSAGATGQTGRAKLEAESNHAGMLGGWEAWKLGRNLIDGFFKIRPY